VDGLGLPTGPGQRHQQVADEPLAQRVRGHHVRQLADHLVVAAQLEFEREALLDRREALLVQLRGGRLPRFARTGRAAPARATARARRRAGPRPSSASPSLASRVAAATSAAKVSASSVPAAGRTQ
jgi:hypothetical protein